MPQHITFVLSQLSLLFQWLEMLSKMPVADAVKRAGLEASGYTSPMSCMTCYKHNPSFCLGLAGLALHRKPDKRLKCCLKLHALSKTSKICFAIFLKSCHLNLTLISKLFA